MSRGGGQHLLELVSGPYRLPCEFWEPERSSREAGVSLVLCHGSTLKGMRHELIRHLARSLSARWPVLAFDLPGFGRAPRLVIERVDDYLFARHVLAARAPRAAKSISERAVAQSASFAVALLPPSSAVALTQM